MPASRRDLERLRGKDLYGVLGVPPSASEKEVKSAYRRLAKVAHPDVRGGKGPSSRFLEIREAYEVLANPDARRNYDSLRAQNLRGGDPNAQRRQPDSRPSQRSPRAPAPPRTSQESTAGKWRRPSETPKEANTESPDSAASRKWLEEERLRDTQFRRESGWSTVLVFIISLFAIGHAAERHSFWLWLIVIPAVTFGMGLYGLVRSDLLGKCAERLRFAMGFCLDVVALLLVLYFSSR